MKKAISIITISLFVLNAIFILGTRSPVESEFLDELGNPNDGEGRIIVLDGEGGQLFDGTTYFDFPLGQGSVLDAQLNITVLEHNNSYPLNPTVNVGLDTDVEWEFSGTGYGQMGYQEYFKDSSTKHTISFTNPGGGSDQTSLIKLPASAEVTNADISMKGRFSQPDFTKFQTGSEDGFKGARFVEIGDIDDDSDLDAVVSSEILNKVVWYKNDGTPKDEEWEQFEISNTLSKAWALDIADMDNNGDLDVVATSNDANNKFGIYWYENEYGNGTSWKAHRIDPVANYTYNPESINVADIDNDGDNDTVVGSRHSSNGGVYWYENANGIGTSWNKHIIYNDISANNEVRDIDVMNINHTASSRLDVAATLYAQSAIVWFENDGNPISTVGNWNRHDISTSSANPLRIVIGDINSDNRNDVVVGYYQSNNIRWYRAPTDIYNSLSWSTYYSVGWLWEIDDIAIAKINDDGYVDVVATSTYYNYLYYFRNRNSGGTSWSSYSIDRNINAMGLAVANIDNDANGNDIVVTGYTSAEIRWYRNGGGSYPGWEVCTIDENNLNGPTSIFIADIDRDGDNDTIALGSRGGDVIWLESPDDPTNTSQQWTVHVIENYLNGVWELFVDDINGDGWLDVAVSVSSPTSKLVWYECPTNPESVSDPWNRTVVDSYLYYAWGVHIADIDGDYDNDIVATGRSANDLVWYQNSDGIGKSWNKYYIDTNINYPTGIWVEDMDGDSDPDVVVGSYYWSSGTGVRWYEAPNDPTGQWIVHTIDSNVRYIYDVHVADIDHNGHPDVVVAPFYDRFLRWYEAPANDPWNGTWIGHDIWSSNDYLYSYNVWVDDIGNDGYFDVVVSRNQYWNTDNIWWFEAPDEPELDKAWTKYNVDALASEDYVPIGVFIADINNDKIQDIIAADYDNNYVNWYEVSISYPEDVILSIGETEVFSVGGILDLNQKHSLNFASVVNDYLSTHSDSPTEDDYGNEFLELRVTTSTTTEGRVTLADIDIIYDYTATVCDNLRGGLSWEITDLIPTGKNGTHRIFIGFTSEAPCSVRFQDLELIYNAAPTLAKNIPDKDVEEDKTYDDLYDLRDFFKDDYEEPIELSYKIKDWTNSEYVSMRIYKQHYLNVSCLQTPNTNWFGTSEVVVTASDVEGIKTSSNRFTVNVLPVNDLPFVNAKLPDLTILFNSTNDQIDLDRTTNPYFKDIDNNKLYYYIEVEKEYKNNISINLSTENILEITAVGGICDNINVTVYCDDKPISKSNLNQITVYQQFHAEVVEFIDETERSTPRWKTLPDCIMEEDNPGLNDWIYLPNYVNDYDDDTKSLVYSIVSISNNAHLEIVIDAEKYIDIFPNENFDETSEVIIKATDDDENYGLGKFNIIMEPCDDPPSVEIIQPAFGAVVKGKVLISGLGVDVEGETVDVKLKIGENIPSNPWIPVSNINSQWTYLFDTSEYTKRTDMTLIARAYDGKLYSDNVSIEIIIDNTLIDSDHDGYTDGVDAFPDDPDEWSDLDDDGVGDNADPFDHDPTQWSDQDGDGWGDNPKGKGYDQFPLDPTQYKDKDGDGWGDNKDGNNPDQYPDDPNRHDDRDSDSEVTGLWSQIGPLFPVWLFVTLLIIIDVYLITYLYMARTGKLAQRRIAKEQKRKKKEAAKLEKKQAKQKSAEKKGKGKDKDKRKAADDKMQPPTVKARPLVIYPDRNGSGFGKPAMGMAPIPGSTMSPPMPGYLFPVSANDSTGALKSSKKDQEKDKDKKEYGIYKEKGKTVPIQTPPYFPLMRGYHPPVPTPMMPPMMITQRPMLPPKTLKRY